MKLTQPVFIIGFMGAGKTTLARKVARLAGVASVDADSYLERSLGRSISEIFETDGEDSFRQWEADVIEELASRDPMLIACGGGVITIQRSRELLQNRGYVIYLKIDVDAAAERVGDDPTRPLFSNDESVRALWNARQPLYESCADATIQTAGKGVGQLSDEVIELLQAAQVLVDDESVSTQTTTDVAHLHANSST